MSDDRTLKVGSLAYFDSFAGLIPCKVLSIDGPSGVPSSRQQVRFRVTSKRFERYGYRFAEVMSEWAIHVVPRKAIYANRQRVGLYRVIGTLPEGDVIL
jgi:hypothetical protein